MEDILPFLTDNIYVKNNRIKSIKLFLKMLDEPSLPNEVYAFRFDFNSDGFPKLSLAFDRDGNIGEQTEYDTNGKKTKKIENHYHTATMQRPAIDTTIYKYNNGLLVEEEEINEDNSFGLYRKELKYKRLYKYDSIGRVIELIENYMPTNSQRKKTYEYPDNNIKKEFDFMDNGKLNMVTSYKHDNTGKLLEIKAVNSYQYEDPSNHYQMYKHVHVYSDGLKREMNSYDNENNLKSNIKYIYDKKNILTSAELFEKGKLSTIWRFEYSFSGILNSIFG